MSASEYFVAIIGGACAGSEAAFQFAEKGVKVAVFEQQPLPYGKIEDGLPKWHIKLRNKEEKKIDGKISHPNVFFIPQTCLGKDVQFEELLNDWGFSAVLLASGAWRDRPLPVEGIDRFINKGFYYQNPLVDWFNHYHEPDYNRQQYEIADNAIVVGGGLASIDVVKILMLEMTVKALAERGIDSNIISLEHHGIPSVLESHGLSLDTLGINGCTLYYRRRDIDMPLASPPPNASPERLEKTRQVRKKILDKAMQKYGFKFQDCCRPVETISDNGSLKGLVFEKTEIVDGRVRPLPGSRFSVESPLTISSIGSIPEPIPQIPVDGELFVIPDENSGQMAGYDRVFALGNAVTGRGNIRESELHARKIAQSVMSQHLGIAEIDDQPAVQRINPLSGEEFDHLMQKVSEFQQRSGYNGDYESWSNKHRPRRLEEILNL